MKCRRYAPCSSHATGFGRPYALAVSTGKRIHNSAAESSMFSIPDDDIGHSVAVHITGGRQRNAESEAIRDQAAHQYSGRSGENESSPTIGVRLTLARQRRTYTWNGHCF